MNAARPTLAVTLGDPRGIGPEIVAAALADPRVREVGEPVVVGPAGTSVPVDVDIGTWSRGGSPAQAGRLSGLAIERAVALANDRTRLAELRSGLRPRLEASPLMDQKRFARNMEALYRQAWRRYCES